MAKMVPKRQAGKPKPPSKPTASGTGKVGGRYTSKTNDPRCTLAMSMLQKAIKAGQKPSAETSRMLAMCRNRSRRRLDAPKRQERLARIQALRKSGNRSEALAIARSDRQGQTARNEAATMLRQLRQGRTAARYTREARSAAGAVTRDTDRRYRGRDLMTHLREVAPRTTLQRAARHARGDFGNEERRRQRRQARAAAPAPPTPPPPPAPPKFSSVEAATRRAQNAMSRGGGDGVIGGERMMKARVLNTLRRTRAGREIIASARQTTAPLTYDRLQNTVEAHESRALARLRTFSTSKATAIMDRAQNGVLPTESSRQQVRQLTARHLLTLRATRHNAIQRASTVGGITVPAYRGSATHQGVNFIRASTSGGSATDSSGRSRTIGRRRAPESARNQYETVRDLGAARRNTSAPTAAPVTPPSTTPAPSTTRTRTTRTTTTRTRTTQAATPTPPATTYRASGVPLPPPQPTSARVTPEQLQEAKTQYGPVDLRYSQNSRIPRHQQESIVREAETLGLNLSGTTKEEKFSHLASILGLPPDAARHVSIKILPNSGYNGSNVIRLESVHPRNSGNLRRDIRIHSDGTLEVYNQLYFPPDIARRDGYATDHYNREILAARAAGIPRIAVSGAGSGDGRSVASSRAQSSTGYYSWAAEYGFDGPINRSTLNVIRNAHPDLANATHYQQAFNHPNPETARAARDAWAMGGDFTHHVQLDIANTDSISFRRYRETFERRRGESWSLSNLRTNGTRSGNYDAYN